MYIYIYIYMYTYECAPRSAQNISKPLNNNCFSGYLFVNALYMACRNKYNMCYSIDCDYSKVGRNFDQTSTLGGQN